MKPRQLVALVCVAQVCAQIGAYTWPALLPRFIAEWRITNGEAGWITGLFYAAYTLSVPVLVTLTDRVDARAVYLTGVGTTVASHLGFALVVDGPWGASVARVLAGVGWAGTYMTGLKLLADRVEPALVSRAVAGHAGSIGIAGALSFVFAGTLSRRLGWRGAFVAAGVAALVAWLIVFLCVPSRERRADAAATGAVRRQVPHRRVAGHHRDRDRRLDRGLAPLPEAGRAGGAGAPRGSGAAAGSAVAGGVSGLAAAGFSTRGAWTTRSSPPRAAADSCYSLGAMACRWSAGAS